MKRITLMRFWLFTAVLCWFVPMSYAQSTALIANGGFEEGLKGWRSLWTRQSGSGKLTLDSQVLHSGKQSAAIEHRGSNDWSFEPEMRIPTQAGDLFEMEAWIRVQGPGSATLCASTWNDKAQATRWSHGERVVTESADWQYVKTRFVVPADTVQIQPRFIGYNESKTWIDDFSIRKVTNVFAGRLGSAAKDVSFSNQVIRVVYHGMDGTFDVTHIRNGKSWRQFLSTPDYLVQHVTSTGTGLKIALFDAIRASGLEVALLLETDKPELSIEIKGEGEVGTPVKYPHPFQSNPGEYLVVPMNEGISYPVEDESIETFRLIAYGGHGICMGFYGSTDGQAGYMTILETSDDAAIRLQRHNKLLTIGTEWDAQLGKFGYARKLRQVFFESGGHVAMAKRYRTHAREVGLLKTLADKRKANPNVDLLIGAVNIWCWDRNAPPLVKDIQAAGIRRILWSNRQSPENLKLLNAMPDVLTSRYDIYQDVMDPEQFPRLRYIHSDWTTAAWPKDIITGARGKWIHGWGVETKDGDMIPCGVICDKRAPDYAKERIPKELASSPYRSRFIDTTTAAPWNECYNPEHIMTRSDSKKWKMELLRYVSDDCKLVTGCETGHEASVPYLHYFEGMLSLGPYRVPDAGRRMNVIWTNVPARVAKFQLGHDYRLPLWELVYHDCVVSQWYWGDYNNKLPDLWDKRDLFNLLYGTPPMFMFEKKLWEQNKDRFVQSYNNTCPYVREVGYSEMTDHKFLAKDRSVQQTKFANGTVITVNFGATPFTLSGGLVIKPNGFNVAKQ